MESSFIKPLERATHSAGKTCYWPKAMKRKPHGWEPVTWLSDN